jgi:hypothetical protein
MSSQKDLSSLLQGWQPGLEPGSGFNRGVWSRIEAAESCRQSGLSSIFSWVGLLARPRIATAAVAVALFGGVLIGGLQAHSSQEERYLLSLKPFAASSLLR